MLQTLQFEAGRIHARKLILRLLHQPAFRTAAEYQFYIARLVIGEVKNHPPVCPDGHGIEACKVPLSAWSRYPGKSLAAIARAALRRAKMRNNLSAWSV